MQMITKHVTIGKPESGEVYYGVQIAGKAGY